MVEGKTLLAREIIEKLRDLVTDLQLIDGTRGHHLAVLGARQPPDGQRAAGAALSRTSCRKAPTTTSWSSA